MNELNHKNTDLTRDDIGKIQSELGLPVTGEVDELTDAAWKNYSLKTGLPYSPLTTSRAAPEAKVDHKDGYISSDLSEAKATTLITRDPLLAGQYLTTSESKNAIFLHFTAGWDNPHAVVRDWNSDKRGAVGTRYVIGGRHPQTLADKYDGDIIETMPANGYAWHLGIGNTSVHRRSVGIEICNTGALRKVGNKYLMWADKEVSSSEVVDLKTEFRGFRYFHKLTDAQLSALKVLLIKIGNDTGIDIRSGIRTRLKKMSKAAAFDFDPAVRDGRESNGIFTHTNVSAPNKWGNFEKWDWPPMDSLIDLLTSI